MPTVQVIFTGEWSMPVREAEATNALIDAGCDVITCHVDSPKVVIETAEGRGVKTCGHNASQAPLAPKGFITGAEYKWITIYSQFADLLVQGRDAAQLRPRRLRQGLRAEHRLRRRRDAGGDRRGRCGQGRHEGAEAGLRRPAQGQRRQRSHRRGHRARALRRLARADRASWSTASSARSPEP